MTNVTHLLSLEGRVAVITGAATGIAREAAGLLDGTSNATPLACKS